MSALYRTRQFLLALGPGLNRAEHAEVDAYLTPRLLALFHCASPAEQRHSLRVLHALRASGAVPADSSPGSGHALAVAALLHDVGKTVQPTSLIGRIRVVLVRATFPGLAWRWGEAATGATAQSRENAGWRAAFVTARHHPEWGAELARAAGAASLVQSLIRRHQSPCQQPQSEEDRLLTRLQQADGEN